MTALGDLAPPPDRTPGYYPDPLAGRPAPAMVGWRCLDQPGGSGGWRSGGGGQEHLVGTAVLRTDHGDGHGGNSGRDESAREDRNRHGRWVPGSRPPPASLPLASRFAA